MMELEWKVGSLTVQFDSEIPAAYIYLPGSEGSKSKRSRQVSLGIIVDFNAKGRPMGIEFLGNVDLEFLFHQLPEDLGIPELRQLEHKRHIIEEILSSPVHR